MCASAAFFPVPVHKLEEEKNASKSISATLDALHLLDCFQFIHSLITPCLFLYKLCLERLQLSPFFPVLNLADSPCPGFHPGSCKCFLSPRCFCHPITCGVCFLMAADNIHTSSFLQFLGLTCCRGIPSFFWCFFVICFDILSSGTPVLWVSLIDWALFVSSTSYMV